MPNVEMPTASTPNVEIKLTKNQEKAFDVLLDDYHTAVGYGG